MSSFLVPATSDDINFFREPRICSGYKHVYPHPKGRLWVSYAFMHQVRIGSSPTPRGAAYLVAGWWKGTFGDSWKEVYETHRKPAWKVVRDKDGGYKLCVWEFGRQKWLPPDDPKLDSFATADDAYDHFARWKKDRYGIFEPINWFFLRRAAVPEYEAWLTRNRRRPMPTKRVKVPSKTPSHPFFAGENS